MAQVYATDTTLTTVTLQLKWKHQFQFAGYYAAIEKGYYKEVGLNINLLEANDTITPADAFINGNADFGITASDIVLMRAEGTPVVVLAEIFQHSAQVLIAKETSGIQHVHNLAGKKIMMEPHAADLIAFMNDEGISLSQVINIPNSYNTHLLINSEIDAMTAYSTDEPFNLREQGVDYNIISPLSGGIDFYGDVLITTEKLILESPELVRRFRQASIKGWEYAMNNKDEIIDVIYNKYSKRHSKQHLRFEAVKMQNLINPKIIEIGYSNLGRWQRIADVYKQTNMLKKDFDIKGLLYADYLEKETKIPWKLLGIFIVGLVLFSLVTIFFYRMSQRLKKEIKNRDITRKIIVESRKELLKSNKKLIQLSSFKEDMTNMIVHDLKSPLSAVINATLIENEQERSNLVQQSGYRMLNMVENILSVYKYENSTIELDKVEVSIIETINKAQEEVSLLVKQKSLTLKVANELNCIINADKDILRRVFVNLFSNAIKFSPVGCAISIKALIRDDKLIKISVFNQGVSIPKEKQMLIFERFGQADKKDTGKISSTGLGLTFCKMAVEAHGGKIGVVSKDEKDVEFWFTLPESFVSIKESQKADCQYNCINNNDKSYLTPFVYELSQLKIYQITAINKVLEKITNNNPNIDDWVSKVRKAVDSNDIAGLKELMKLIS